MALTKINNNTLSAITTLPAAGPTGKIIQVVHAHTATIANSSATSY
jgi:hypothetical protein